MSTKIIGIIVIVLIVVGGGVFYFVTSRQSSTSIPGTKTPSTSGTSAIPTSSKPTFSVASKPVLKSQPGAVATITGVVMSKSIAASGAAVAPKAVFSLIDPTIYAVLSLKNTTRYSELSYIRYYKGKYVDSKVSHPTKDGVKYFHFDWTLKAGQTRKAGNYTLNFYINGNKEKTLNYVIR